MSEHAPLALLDCGGPNEITRSPLIPFIVSAEDIPHDYDGTPLSTPSRITAIIQHPYFDLVLAARDQYRHTAPGLHQPFDGQVHQEALEYLAIVQQHILSSVDITGDPNGSLTPTDMVAALRVIDRMEVVTATQWQQVPSLDTLPLLSTPGMDMMQRYGDMLDRQ